MNNVNDIMDELLIDYATLPALEIKFYVFVVKNPKLFLALL